MCDNWTANTSIFFFLPLFHAVRFLSFPLSLSYVICNTAFLSVWNYNTGDNVPGRVWNPSAGYRMFHKYARGEDDIPPSLLGGSFLLFFGGGRRVLSLFSRESTLQVAGKIAASREEKLTLLDVGGGRGKELRWKVHVWRKLIRFDSVGGNHVAGVSSLEYHLLMRINYDIISNKL